MKRTRSSSSNGGVPDKAVLAGDNAEEHPQDDEDAPFLALPDAPGVAAARSILPANLSPETMAMATATAKHVKGFEELPPYTPVPHSIIPPPSDQVAAFRNLMLFSVKSSNIAAGWCARWPRVATVDVILRFSEDLIAFFAVPVNLQNVFQDLGRRNRFSGTLNSLHVLINTNVNDLNEYLNAVNSAAEYRTNKMAVVLEQRQTAILLLKGAVAPCSPTLVQDINTYFAQSGAAYARLAKVMIRLEKVLADLHDVFLQLHALMLAEVPQQIRDLLWPK